MRFSQTVRDEEVNVFTDALVVCVHFCDVVEIVRHFYDVSKVDQRHKSSTTVFRIHKINLLKEVIFLYLSSVFNECSVALKGELKCLTKCVKICAVDFEVYEIL